MPAVATGQVWDVTLRGDWLPLGPQDRVLAEPTGSRPTVAMSALRTLPYDDLAWDDFERLVLDLASVEGIGLESRLHGGPGRRQDGLDVLGRDRQGGLHGFQAKRRAQFGPQDLRAAVHAYTDGRLRAPLVRLVIAVSRPLSSPLTWQARDEEDEAQAFHVELWDASKINELLRQQPRIVAKYFGREAAGRFCDLLQPEPAPPQLLPPLPVQGVHGRDRFVDVLLNELQADDLSRRLVALHGVGGMGKTTVAAMIGWEAVRRGDYPDGVVMTSLGIRPSTRRLLDRLGRAFELDLRPEPDASACVESLREHLRHRRVLLIVDDVWAEEEALPFLVAGPDSRVLLTTRAPEIATGLALDRSVKLDVLKRPDSLNLLASLTGDLPSARPQEADLLCDRLGDLPLSLTLAGRLLATEPVPGRLGRLLDDLAQDRQVRLDLRAREGRLGSEPSTPMSLRGIVGLSVDLLAEPDRQRFSKVGLLGAQPLTWVISEAAAAWRCTVTDAEDTVSRLVRQGLVDVPVDADAGYGVHASLVDYAMDIRAAAEPQQGAQ